jgi:hypothetical protein
MKCPTVSCLCAVLAGGCGSVPATAPVEDAAPPSPSPDGAAVAPAADGRPAADRATTPAGDSTDGATPADWWDPHWHKRARITIGDSEVKADLTDFQVPVKLEAGTIDYAAAKPDGADLRFVADGTLLNHEIDAWTSGGPALVWLRVPKLSATPAVVWLYYGNPDAPAPADADVHGVWHLSGGGKDATSHGFDGAQMVGGAFVDGPFAKGLQLDGSKREHITLKPDLKLLAGAPGCTFSAWINPTKIEDSENGMIIMTIGKWFNNNHNSYADFNINAAGQMISHIDPGPNTAPGGYARILSDPGFIKTNEWAWVTYVIDLPGKQERFFKNGQLVSTKPPPAGKSWAAAFIDMVSTRVVIGAEEDVVSHWYTGSMDELRLETGMRPPEWIAAQYRAMTVPGYVEVEAP